MRIILDLTEDMLKLISMLRIEDGDEDDTVTILSEYSIGSHLLEDMATILNMRDKAIPNSENDADGMAFDKDTEEYLIKTHNYIKKNLKIIEYLIHQYVCNGKQLTPGTYIALDTDNIFRKQDDI